MDRHVYTEKLKAQIDKWDTQLDLMKARMEKADAATRKRIQDKVSEFRVKLEAAKEQQRKLRDAASETWEELKETTDALWVDLKNSAQEIYSA